METRWLLAVVLVLVMTLPAGASAQGAGGPHLNPIAPAQTASHPSSTAVGRSPGTPVAPPISPLCTYCIVNNITVGKSANDVAYVPDNQEIYVTNSEANTTMAINSTTQAVVATIATGAYPWQLTFDPLNHLLYVSDDNSDNVTVIDPATNTVVGNIVLTAVTAGLAVDTRDGLLYLVTGQDLVSVVNPTTDTVLQTIPVGPSPWAVIYSAATDRLFVGDTYGTSDNLTVIDASTNKTVGSVSVGQGPTGMALDPRDGQIFVANYYTNNLSVVDPSTMKAVASIHSTYDPRYVAFDNITNQIDVSDQQGGNVTIYNATSYALNGNIVLGNSGQSATNPTVYPNGIAVDPANGDIYDAIQYSYRVAVIAPAHTLVSVVASPASSTLLTGGYVDLNGSTRCLPGPCSLAPYIVWSPQTGPVGNLNASGGSGVTFTAGTTPGAENVSYSAMLRGVTIVGIPVTIRVIPPLVGVSVTPSTLKMAVGNSTTLASSLTCNPNPCYAPDAVYAWSSSPATLGTLLTTNTSSVVFKGGSAAGVVQVSLSVTMVSSTVPGNTASLTLLANLTTVSVTPLSPAVPIDNGTTLTANLGCVGGACPAGAAYLWSVSGGFGTLLSTGGPSVGFKAGSAAGSATVLVNVSLNGHWATSGPIAVAVQSNLSSLALSASRVTVPVGERLTLSGTPICLGGPCSTGTKFLWSVSNALGTLLPTTGSGTIFTAGSTLGVDTVFLNATDHGQFTVATPLALTIVANLSSVSVAPLGPLVPIGGSQIFWATVSCVGGFCPSGTTYAWSLSNGLGSLGTSTGPSATFTAGSVVGTDTLFLNASLNGVQISAAPEAITLLPALASVSVTPNAAAVQTGSQETFAATPACNGGACPSGATYFWSLTNTVGSISGTSTAASMVFLAGSLPGTDQLTVSVTLDSRTILSPAVSILVSTTAPPLLTGVSLTPATGLVQVGHGISFNATLSCSGGSACPSTVGLLWSLNSTRGTLNSTHGLSVAVLAGSSAGVLGLTVAASLNGAVREANGTLDIGTGAVASLTSVSIAPGAPAVDPSASLALVATPNCSSGSCPSSGITYVWTVAGAFGTVSPTTGATTTFKAGSSAGTETVTVTASYNGVSRASSVAVTINSPGPGSRNGILGLPFLAWVGIVLLVVLLVALLFRSRSRSRGRAAAPAAPSSATGPGPYGASVTPQAPALVGTTAATPAMAPAPSAPSAPPAPLPPSPSPTPTPSVVPPAAASPPVTPAVTSPSPSVPPAAATPTPAAAEMAAPASPPAASPEPEVTAAWPAGALTVMEATEARDTYRFLRESKLPLNRLLLVTADGASTLKAESLSGAQVWRLTRTEAEGTVRPDDVDRLGSIIERHLDAGGGAAVALVGLEVIIEATSLRIARRLLSLIREVAESRDARALVRVNPALVDDHARRQLEEGATVLR